MITLRRIIPNVWSAVCSYGPQEPNQSKSNKSKKDPIERVTFLSQLTIYKLWSESLRIFVGQLLL